MSRENQNRVVAALQGTNGEDKWLKIGSMYYSLLSSNMFDEDKVMCYTILFGTKKTILNKKYVDHITINCLFNFTKWFCPNHLFTPYLLEEDENGNEKLRELNAFGE